MLCNGPDLHLAGDHSIAVDAVLESAGSCAAIWLFWTGEHGGYVVRICQASVSLAVDRAPDRRLLGTLSPARPIELHRPLPVELFARTSRVQVFLDHRYLGDFSLPAGDPKDGTDALGLSVESLTGKPPYAVTYANVDVRTYGQ